jgi:hypothetical protein
MHSKGDPLLGYLEALQFTSSELQNFLALQCVYDAWIELRRVALPLQRPTRLFESRFDWEFISIPVNMS